MIFDLFASFFTGILTGIVDALIGLIPPPPPEVITGMDVMRDLYEVIATAEVWVPVDLALQLIAVTIGAYFIALSIGLARVVASYFTLGGGAT